MVLGDADDLEVECDDDADGEYEPEGVVGDGEDGVVPEEGEAGAELGAEGERRERGEARHGDGERDEPRHADEGHGLAEGYQGAVPADQRSRKHEIDMDNSVLHKVIIY